MMKDLIIKFTQQLKEAINIGEQAQLTPSANSINNVLISGLGGSGIGGTTAAEIVASTSNIPIVVSKDYFIPAFVGPNTLVIVSSYSGNTEETLNAFKLALEKGAKIVCVSSGGKIIELAKETKTDHIIIPSGMPPRACFGYSFTQLFYILKHFSLISDDFKKNIKAAIQLLDQEEEDIRSKAKNLAKGLYKKIPIIYTVANFEGVAIRFRQQINENAKMLCWHHVLPEMNHNELVGWTEKNDRLAIIILRNTSDYYRTQKRIEISKEVFSKYTPNIFEIYSKGDSVIEKVLYHIHLCDWASYFLAEQKQIDAVEVNVIDFLKGSLEKV